VSIRSESIPWVAGSVVPALLSYGLWIYFGTYWFLGLFIGFAALSIFFIYFFRDPDREPDFDRTGADFEPERNWLAPADGIVTRLDEEDDGRVRIVVFLTVFNVHVNRMPVSGEICGIEYCEGQFLPAFADNLEKRNERNRILCRDTFSRPFEVWQIAGMLARRIHFWNEVDDVFNQGDRFGMISLGSRTDLVLPPEVSPTVTLDQSIRGGRTVIAQG
jgi:phosphatidylserine decarboxylase